MSIPGLMQSLTRPFVELPSHFVELGLRVHGQVGPLRKVLWQKTVGFLIGTTLLARSGDRIRP
jgi:hypothetical protein